MTLSQSILERQLSRPFKYFDQVDSTNDVAKAWLAAGAPEGAVVIANAQTRGRGRKDRSWRTPPNAALALSIILKPAKAHLSRLNMVAALSVYDLAAEVGCEELGIKWPNDVEINGRKVCGVLPEALWEGGRLAGAVLGIGVNVRVDFERSPLSGTAISLEDVVERRLDRAQLSASLLCRSKHWYEQIGAPVLHKTWKSRLTTLNRAVAVDGVAGVAVDALPDGSLLIRDESGRIQQAGSGELYAHSDDEGR